MTARTEYDPRAAAVARYEERFEYHCEAEQIAVHNGREDVADAHRAALTLLLDAIESERMPR